MLCHAPNISTVDLGTGVFSFEFVERGLVWGSPFNSPVEQYTLHGMTATRLFAVPWDHRFEALQYILGWTYIEDD